jgi:hypothetical protein
MFYVMVYNVIIDNYNNLRTYNYRFKLINIKLFDVIKKGYKI